MNKTTQPTNTRLGPFLSEKKPEANLPTTPPPAVVLLVGNHDDRGLVVCKTSDGIGEIDASVLVRTMASILGGGGGGNSTFAQGGGPQTEKVDEALRAGVDAARSLLEGSG